jgi:nuclear pore complex protein Nup133
MFSPEVSVRSVSGGSSRNPRRRQRHDSDTIKQQPVRKRSKLSEQTFSAPEAKSNGNGHLETNGHQQEDTRRQSTPGMHQLAVREKKKDRRAAKEDGTTLLVWMELH